MTSTGAGTPDTPADGVPGRSRRTVLAVVGAAGVTAVLTGCQTYGGENAAPPVDAGAPAQESGEPTVDASAEEPAAGASGPGEDGEQEPPAEEPPEPAEPAGEVLASLSDIPVGGGVVFADKGIVVTCPKEGTVKGFSVTCPHAGCAVNQVSGGTINCPCHGSKFRVADGSVAAGPAAKGLPPVRLTVDGDSIRRA